jgi:hypothetical protein
MKAKRCSECKGEGWVQTGVGEAGVRRCEGCNGEGVVAGAADDDDDGPTVVRPALRVVAVPTPRLRVAWHKESEEPER